MGLTEEQIQKAKEWLSSRKDHVDKLIKLNGTTPYAPTDNEDKNNPMLWKANHWWWFLKTYSNY